MDKNEEAKQEALKNIIDAVDKLAAKGKKSAFEVALEYLQEEGNTIKILPAFGGNIKSVYLALAKHYKKDADKFKEKASENTKSLLNNTNGFMERLAKLDDKDGFYHCRVFQQLDTNGKATPVRFPNGTLAFIAARTGRGKTTAMISVALDALQQGKKVFFVTYEEATHQIIMRMIKAYLYAEYANGKWPDVFEFNDLIHNYNLTDETIVDLTKYINFTLKQPNTMLEGQPLQRSIWVAFKKVDEVLKSKQFTIVDGFEHGKYIDFEEVLEIVPSKSVVLLDYIQHIRRPEVKGGADYMPLKMASENIRNIAAKNDFVVISGAQLNRNATDEKGEDEGKPDKFGEQFIRECGDLEQDAFVHIQIGMQRMIGGQLDKFGGKVSRFYQILKHRDNDQDNNKYWILNSAKFSLYGCLIDGKLHPFEKNETAAAGQKPAGNRQTPKKVSWHKEQNDNDDKTFSWDEV